MPYVVILYIICETYSPIKVYRSLNFYEISIKYVRTLIITVTQINNSTKNKLCQQQ